MSVILDTFLNLEVTEGVKKKILNIIQNLRYNNIESEEITFNIYSLTINIKKSQVLISNDIVADDQDEVMSLEDFCEVIRNYVKK